MVLIENLDRFSTFAKEPTIESTAETDCVVPLRFGIKYGTSPKLALEYRVAKKGEPTGDDVPENGQTKKLYIIELSELTDFSSRDNAKDLLHAVLKGHAHYINDKLVSLPQVERLLQMILNHRSGKDTLSSEKADPQYVSHQEVRQVEEVVRMPMETNSMPKSGLHDQASNTSTTYAGDSRTESNFTDQQPTLETLHMPGAEKVVVEDETSVQSDAEESATALSEEEEDEKSVEIASEEEDNFVQVGSQRETFQIDVPDDELGEDGNEAKKVATTNTTESLKQSSEISGGGNFASVKVNDQEPHHAFDTDVDMLEESIEDDNPSSLSPRSHSETYQKDGHSTGADVTEVAETAKGTEKSWDSNSIDELRQHAIVEEKRLHPHSVEQYEEPKSSLFEGSSVRNISRETTSQNFDSLSPEKANMHPSFLRDPDDEETSRGFDDTSLEKEQNVSLPKEIPRQSDDVTLETQAPENYEAADPSLTKSKYMLSLGGDGKEEGAGTEDEYADESFEQTEEASPQLKTSKLGSMRSSPAQVASAKVPSVSEEQDDDMDEEVESLEDEDVVEEEEEVISDGEANGGIDSEDSGGF